MIAGSNGPNRDAPPGLDQLDAAVCLLNRRHHYRRLAEWIKSTKKSGVAILPGVSEDLHELFLERIARPDSGPLGPDCEYLGLVRWPDCLDDVLGELTGRLQALAQLEPGSASRRFSRSRFEKTVRRRTGSVMFYHSIHGARCREDDGELLKAWLTYFGRECPKPGRGLTLSILCVTIREPPTPSCTWLRTLLAEKAQELGSNILVLDPLPLVTDAEVQEWVEDRDLKRSLPEWRTVLKYIHVEAFRDSGAGHLRLSALRERILKAALESPFRPKWQGFEPSFTVGR